MIKAYAAHAPGAPLQPFEYDPGPLGPQDVEIAVRYCGICHSDLSMLNDDWGMTQFPLVPGHEIVGTISQLGSEVDSLSVGQDVGLGWHSGYCMSCGQCMSGDHNLCAGAEGTIVGRHGGFAEAVRARAQSVVPLPQGIDLESAGPLFCGGITVFNPIIQLGIKGSDQVGVVGIGGLGHMALRFLSAWGCRVTAFTSSESKTDEALEMGASDTINSRDAAALEAAAGSFDVILSTVNVKLDWNAYIAALKPRGHLHLLGATLDPLDLQVFPLLMGQRSVSASPVGSPVNIARMLDFAAQHDIRPVVETFGFDQVNEAMDRLRSGQARYRIVLAR